MWTHFWDMYSGGGLKEKKLGHIFIEAPEREAKIIFYNRFGHNPERVSCTCCGEDYSISESPSLEDATAFHRGCRWANPRNKKSQGRYFDHNEEIPEGWEVSNFSSLEKKITLEDYLKSEEVLVIYENEIKADEKIGEVPDQGYVWVE